MRLDRRTLLRGMAGGSALAVGLPPLQAMLNASGTAFADGTAIPKRFGLWFWANGVNDKYWAPSSTGRGWAPSPSLKPFADKGVLDYVSVVTNTHAPTKGYWAHHTSYKTLFASAAPIYPQPDYKGFPDKYGGPRFDDLIRSHLGGKTRFNGVSVRVSRAVSGAAYLTGDAKISKHNPEALFDELFSGFSPGSVGSVAPSTWVVGLRKSMLDAVKADAADVKNKIGAADRARLDEHLEGIRGLEKSVEAAANAPQTTCALPAKPGARPADMPGRKEPLQEVNEAMANLVTYALACDLSRTVNFTFHDVQSDTVFWQVGLDQGHHGFGHNEPGDQPMIQKTVVFIMEQLAFLIAKLKSVPVGAGNLLDHCLIFGTSEQNSPRGHSTYNMPSLIIGRAGGALKGGVHHQAVPSSSQRDMPQALHTRIPLTIMRAVGMPAPTFGVGPNLSTSSISELEA